MDRLTIVKVGGKVVEDELSLQQLLRDFSAIAGYKILVHGGGLLATQIAEKLGIESRMVDGRRITDEETLKVVTMVYAGLVNKNIVAGLQAIGQNALGMTGADLNIIRSRKRPVEKIDYGFAGDVQTVDGATISKLLKDGVIPVLAPLTHDGDGCLLNTNADTIAGETAKELVNYFDVRLVYCFEKSGVLMDENDDQSVIHRMNRKLFDLYLKQRIITGGMIPKLENAFQAIQAGVKEVIITRADGINLGKGTIITP